MIFYFAASYKWDGDDWTWLRINKEFARFLRVNLRWTTEAANRQIGKFRKYYFPDLNQNNGLKDRENMATVSVMINWY